MSLLLHVRIYPKPLPNMHKQPSCRSGVSRLDTPMEPEGKAGELEYPWLLTALIVGFVCFKRMNSDSTPIRKEPFGSFLAFLEGMFSFFSKRGKSG